VQLKQLVRGCSGLARIRSSVLPAEALNAAGGIHQLLLAGKERMAVGANFQMQLLAFVGGAGGKAVAAGAQHFNLVVAGVDSLFWHSQPFVFPGPGAGLLHLKTQAGRLQGGFCYFMRDFLLRQPVFHGDAFDVAA
jgi:hypothetical protein